MLAQSRVDDATIKQYLGGIRDVLEDLQRLVEFIVVVMTDGGHPGLDFLQDFAVSG
jgi:hypothetical protein